MGVDSSGRIFVLVISEFGFTVAIKHAFFLNLLLAPGNKIQVNFAPWFGCMKDWYFRRREKRR